MLTGADNKYIIRILLLINYADRKTKQPRNSDSR